MAVSVVQDVPTAPKLSISVYRGALTAPRRKLIIKSGPAELAHRHAVVPDLRHVEDLVAVEVHHVHVVGFGGFARRRYRAAVAGVRPVENPEHGHVVARLVDGE